MTGNMGGVSLYGQLGLVSAFAAGLLFLLYRWRFNKFAHIPSPMPRNLFLGHLGFLGAEYKHFESSSVHSDYVFERLCEKNGRPDFMFFDIRPIEHPVVVITTHELAEQISRATKQQPYSTTKSPTLQTGLRRLIGRQTILSKEGEEWKRLRRQFNPGFAPQHLVSLLPVAFRKTHILAERLDALAGSGEAAALEPLLTNVTFDIIAEVSTGINCKAQAIDPADEDAMVQSFRLLTLTYLGDNAMIPAFLKLPTQIKRVFLSRRLDSAVKACIRDRYKAMQKDQTDTKDRSVLGLALKTVDTMTPEILQEIADSIKTFLFAGHDTTSTLLQRLFYELSIRPGHLAKLRAEHDVVLGKGDPMEAFMARPEETMKAMVYTSACVKEALRLWPPAGSARMSHNNLKLNTAQGQVCLDKCVLYICHYMIQRDPRVYGETATDFMPERWLDNHEIDSSTLDTDDAQANKIPNGAWRPFERGPKSCIGQELANIEVKVILACTMRRYDFVKVGVGEAELNEKGMPTLDAKGRYKLKSELLNTIAITAKPMDQTVMKVKLRQFGDQVG